MAAFGDPRAVVTTWVVPPDAHGMTAVEALAHKVRRLGVDRARSVVDSGDLRHRHGDALRPDERVHKGAVVELWRLPPDDPHAPFPHPTVLYEGGGLIVVDKPGDLAVHPSARYLFHTVTGWLKARGTPANPCHRLDRETSGVLVCAVAGVVDVERAVKGAFAAGRVQKTYRAVVRGLVDSAFVVDAPLALQGERGLVRIRMIADPAGQPARTEVVPIAVDTAAGRSLVECTPRTGRQHQIRAHLALAGHPIVGDKLYAMGDRWFDAFTRRALTDDDLRALEHRRQALHAAVLQLLDDERRFEAPFPAELACLLTH